MSTFLIICLKRRHILERKLVDFGILGYILDVVYFGMMSDKQKRGYIETHLLVEATNKEYM